MLQNGLGLVLLDRLGHHVEDVVHDRRTELQVEVRLDALLGDRFGNSFAIAPLELAGEKVSEPKNKRISNTAGSEIGMPTIVQGPERCPS